MKIALIQDELEMGKVDKNFSQIENCLSAAAEKRPDVIVLPEMWNTSFFPDDVINLADESGRRSRRMMSQFASNHQINVVGGSIALKEDDKLYNTSFIYDRKGQEIGKYEKVHCFSPSGEDQVFDAGDAITTFELDGIKCGIVICYDIRFPEWIRLNALQGIQILFVPAAWPSIRTMHWDTLNRARAIENQMFVVCVNSTGLALQGEFGGHSAIIDPWGEYVVVPDEKNEIKIGDVDFSVIEDIRNSINVFRDRRPALYRKLK